MPSRSQDVGRLLGQAEEVSRSVAAKQSELSHCREEKNRYVGAQRRAQQAERTQERSPEVRGALQNPCLPVS